MVAPADSSVDALRERTKDWARSRWSEEAKDAEGQRGKPEAVRNEDPAFGKDVVISWQGAKHAISNANQAELRLIPHIAQILKAAKFVATKTDKAGRRDILAAHQFSAKVVLDGESLTVGIVVRERADGRFFYDQFIINEARPRAGTSETASTGVSAGLGVQPSGGGEKIVDGKAGIGQAPAESFEPEAVKAQGQAPMFSRGPAVDQTQTPEFKRWYGDWQNAADGRNDERVPAGVRHDARGTDPLSGVQRAPGMDRRAGVRVAVPFNVGTQAAFSGASGPTGADGTPLRLYHGTRDDITAFDLSHPNRKDHGWLGAGVYLTSNDFYATQYAQRKRGEHGPLVMPVYANVRNPYVATEAEKTRVKAGGPAASKAFTEYTKALGHDGVVLDLGEGAIELVAFDPAQVKSATGNNGNFDPANPDIRFQRQGDEGVAEDAGMANMLQAMGQTDKVVAQAVERVRSTADAIRAGWANGPEVVVAFDMSDPAIPRAARRADQSQRSGGADGEPEGFFYNGKVYLLASQLATDQDAARVLFHEALGHHGLRGLYGKELDSILAQIVVARREEVVDKARDYGLLDQGKLEGVALKDASRSQIWRAMSPQHKLEAAEEVLAEMAQARPELGFVRRAVAAVRNWLRRHVPGFAGMRMTDADLIEAFILPARGWVERGVGGRNEALAAMTTALSRSEGGRAFGVGNDAVVADFANDQPLKRHADYKAAKAGDTEAAVKVVRDLVKPESLAQAREAFGPEVIYVPVHAMEASGKNKLPNALAMLYASATGASVDLELTQSNKAFHTGAGPMERLMNRAEFDGAVRAGRRYVLVDDVTTMGSTLADLAAYIQRHGGQVAGSVVMVNAMRGGKIAPLPKTIKQLEARHGSAIREILGIDANQLTGPEAQYLIGFKSADEIRDRGTKARQERVARLDAKQVLSERQAGVAPEGGSGPSQVGDGPLFSRAAVSLTEGYSPAQQHAAELAFGSITKQTLAERARSMRANLGAKLRQGLVDQFAPIKEVSEKAYILARLSKGSDGAVEAALLYGKPFLRDGVADVDMKEGGFAQVLASLQGEHDRFFQWVAAQRAERLKAEGKENLLTDQDISALKTLNAGRFADGAERMPVYRAALRELNLFNEAALKVALDSGLIDKAAFDLMKGQPYVPFYRLMEEEGGMRGPRFSSGLVNQQAWKKLKGGTQQLNADLLQNTLMNWSHLYAAAARNRASLETMAAADKMGIAYQVPADTKGAVKVMRNGVAEHWAVEDPYLLDAISAMSYSPGGVAKAMAPFKRLLTFGVTVNPAFKIRNLIRDSLSAVAQSDLSYNPLENVAKGWKATSKDSQTYASMLASGGVIKFGTQENSDRVRAQIKRLGGQVLDAQGVARLKGQMRSLWEAYEEFGDRTENVNRAALYDRLIAKGHSHAEAAFMARDLMDFSMSGKWEVVRFLTQTVPFLNARLQGLYKLGRAAQEDPRRFAAVVGAVSLASLGLLAAYGDDDDWKRRGDEDRDNYWWFKIGDTAFYIPKPFEVGAIGTLAERTAELMLSKEMTGQRFGQRISDMVFNTFAMDPTPQLLKPLLDVYANKDSFSGRAIEGMAEEKLRPQDRYDERTSEVARLLGSWGLPDPVRLAKGEYSGLSPKQVDFLLRGYFGWLATVGTTATDMAARPLLDRGERPSMQMRDVFLAGNFVKNLPSGSSRYVTAMYDQARDMEQAWASYQAAMKAGDRERAQEIREKDGDLLRGRPAMAQAKKQMAELGQRAKHVVASRELSAEEKRSQLNDLEVRKDAIARRVAAVR